MCDGYIYWLFVYYYHSCKNICLIFKYLGRYVITYNHIPNRKSRKHYNQTLKIINKIVQIQIVRFGPSSLYLLPSFAMNIFICYLDILPAFIKYFY